MTQKKGFQNTKARLREPLKKNGRANECIERTLEVQIESLLVETARRHAPLALQGRSERRNWK